MLTFKSCAIFCFSLLFLYACGTYQTSELSPVMDGSTVAKQQLNPIRDDAPTRYVVQRGDTLWGIAERFLHHPAYWKKIWYANPQIKHPNRIYPGDVLTYQLLDGQKRLYISDSRYRANEKGGGKKTTDGRPIYKLSPTNDSHLSERAITILPAEAVAPFVSNSLILSSQELEQAPYLLAAEQRPSISLTQENEIYALGQTFDAEQYDVFHKAGVIIDPETQQPLGVEATYVGRLEKVKPANQEGIATFKAVNIVRAMYPSDVLIPTQAVALGDILDFQPRLPQINKTARIIKTMGQGDRRAASQFDTLLLNIGREAGLREGDVFNIVRAKRQVVTTRDKRKVLLPEQVIGSLIVYRVQAQTAYALVMRATDIIYPDNRLVVP